MHFQVRNENRGQQWALKQQLEIAGISKNRLIDVSMGLKTANILYMLVI